jgi:hypothetical protein
MYLRIENHCPCLHEIVVVKVSWNPIAEQFSMEQFVTERADGLRLETASQHHRTPQICVHM